MTEVCFYVTNGEVMYSFGITVITDRLREMLEDVEVRSANWRRYSEKELSLLTGDEKALRKEEFDKRKKQNDQVRDRIRSHISRLQKPTTGSGDVPAQRTSNLGDSTSNDDAEACGEDG